MSVPLRSTLMTQLTVQNKSKVLTGLIFLVLLLLGCDSYRRSEDALKNYEVIAQPTIYWIEGYRKMNGALPEALDPAIKKTLVRLPVSFDYTIGRDGESYSIAIGDYGKDGFIYYYNSNQEKWFLDS